MYGAQCVSVWCVFSNLVDYGKSIRGYERLVGLAIHKSDVMEVFYVYM